MTVEALTSGCVQACPVASCCCCTEPDIRLNITTVAGLLPADVPTLSRGESHHKSELRKERPVPQYWRPAPQPLLMGNVEGSTVTASFNNSLFCFSFFIYVLGTVFVTARQPWRCCSSSLAMQTGCLCFNCFSTGGVRLKVQRRLSQLYFYYS